MHRVKETCMFSSDFFFLEMHVKCEVNLSRALNTQSLGARPSPYCPKDWGGVGVDLLPMMEFSDCSMPEEEVGGEGRYEVLVLHHSSATIIAALQQH